MRLFVAINTDAPTKRRIIAVQDMLRRHAVSDWSTCSAKSARPCDLGNFTTPDNLHLTLVFIGESDDAQGIIRAMDSVGGDAFTLTFDGAGTFRDGLWWLGCDKPPQLLQIQRRLSDALRGIGYEIENRAFKPHLTIARQVVTRTQPVLTYEPFPQQVASIELMQSHRVNGRLTYTPLHSTPLQS